MGTNTHVHTATLCPYITMQISIEAVAYLILHSFDNVTFLPSI